ncbi:Putative drug/metabolite exporter family transporter [Sodalis praecaptivus]|uniref:Putative drug/metabolite exporter family transporter n=1 Tax=Sodalis praecaptivus TaxID=1239307 RepID=W0HZ79_9GAMM|nr:DMT family transporter [Sodalis praecaptivus]AHF77505.1 Putative drug/metabolite exporter family transporter [Sodalis praecaptivus]
MRRITISLLFILVCLTWGTTWLAMKIAVDTIPPVFATGMRFIAASPLLIIMAWLTRAPLLFPRGQRLFQCAVALFYFAIPFSLMIYGEQTVSSGLASVIFANMPVVVLGASLLLLKEKTCKLQLLGLLLAIASLAVVLISEAKETSRCHWQGALALVAALIMHAIMYTLCKKRGCCVAVLTYNALPCCAAGVALAAVGWLYEHPRWHDFSLGSVGATLYLGVVAGVFGILCYFALQKKASAFQASTVFLIFPVIALLLENALYGYTLSPVSRLLLLPLSAGILLTLLSRRPTQAPAKVNP